MLRPLLLALAFIVPNGLVAQSKKDSLLQQHNTGKANGSVYNELIWTYVFNQPDSAIFFGKHGLSWVEQTGNDSLLASMYNRIGVAYDIRSIPDSSLHFYQLAIDEAQRKQNRKTEAGALNNIGLIHWNKGALDKAIDYYIRAATIFEEDSNLRGLGNAYNNIGIILFEDDQLAKGLQYFRKALDIREDIDDASGLAATYMNIAQLYSDLHWAKPDSSIYFLQKAIPLYERANDRYGLARAIRNLADTYEELKNFDSALALYQQALDIQKSLGNAEGYASTYYNMANPYRLMGNTTMQLAYLDSAQLVAESRKDLSLLWKVYRTKARALGTIGEHADAHLYWIAYDNLKDSLVNAERSRQVEELETKYRTAQKDAKLAAQKADLAESRLLLENRNKWVFGLVGTLLSILFLSFALFQAFKRRTQADKDAAIIAERERGLEAMIAATEEERKRIAKDLHDGIVQSLTGLSLQLQKGFSFLDSLSENDKKEFDDSRKMLNESIAELRTISHQMMPRVLSEMGLIPALDDMLNKSLGNTSIKYEFEHHKVEGERFAENVEVSLYRICQELVNNIIKHSEAKAVSVQLLKTKTHLVLVVEDNGKGFEFDGTNQNGIGLMNINSRAKAIKGEVNYQPSPEQGTVATIRIPLS